MAAVVGLSCLAAIDERCQAPATVVAGDARSTSTCARLDGAALMIAVALSIAVLLVQAATAPVRRLGQLPGGALADLDQFPDAREQPRTLVVRPMRRASLRMRMRPSSAYTLTQRIPRLHTRSSSTSG